MKAEQARVLLTGAAGGIGRASVDVLLAAGASVLLVGRDPRKLQQLMAQAAQRHEGAAARLAWQCADLQSDQEIAALARVGMDWGCNVLVHGAGVPAFGPLTSLDAVTLRGVMQTNLLAPMLLTQSLLTHLMRQPRAQIICVGSALGRIGLPGFSAYCASKFGLRGFAEALRREVADSGVLIQYLGPRSTRTEFNDAAVQAYNQATKTAIDAPERVARELLSLLVHEAPERFIGFPEVLAVRLNGLLGAAMDGAFVKHGRSLGQPAVPQQPFTHS